MTDPQPVDYRQTGGFCWVTVRDDRLCEGDRVISLYRQSYDAEFVAARSHVFDDGLVQGATRGRRSSAAEDVINRR